MKSLGLIRRNLLNELLSLPRLMAQLQSLPTADFHQIIVEVGLEDCGELISMATASQLEELFDVDLWQHTRPGEKERFDSQRFVLWLEMLLDAGEDVAVEKVCELNGDLLTFAMAKELLVLSNEDMNSLFRHEDDESRQADTLLESCLYEELFEFQLISRNCETWDTILVLLVALDKAHHEFLWQLLDRLAGMGSQQIAEESLHVVLSEIQSLADDVAQQRDARRGEKGYVSSLDAKAFLGLADAHTIDELLHPETRDAITTMYFRAYTRRTAASASAQVDVSDVLTVLKKHLSNVSSLPATGLLEGDIADNQTLFQFALQRLNADAPMLYQTRISELSFLGNVISAGCSLQGKAMRDVDASRAAMATCALGIHVALDKQTLLPSETNMLEVIRKIHLERLFLTGWKTLPRKTSAPREFVFKSQDRKTSTYYFFDNLSLLKHDSEV